MTLRVLIAEDDHDVAEVVAYGVRLMWSDALVTIAGNGAEALRHFTVEQTDLIILDVSMPPPDGFEVCRRIRALSRLPILMLTARSNILDKVRALDLGADDYLTKPFDHLELLARLRALRRRAVEQTPTEYSERSIGVVTLDGMIHQVRVRNETVHLTPTEYRLLDVLMQHTGTTLPHLYLLERVWGPEYVAESHYLKIFVERLRRKLGDDAVHPRYIETVRGIGYRFLSAP